MRTGHGRGISGLFRLYPAELIGERIGPQQRAIKEAVTAFSVLERAEDATLVEARPHTGRTHQIRLHLAALGHPILGDRRYGGPQSVGELRIEHHLLHACELQLQHPASGELLTLRAPLPDHFAATLQELRKSLKT
ncbi:MAG: hypothetical protein KatS3mg057_2418 [Herpetosiphonaceae bacterium]|nr:MAG: hypothetical protein KatS3mg057_2418 [Herpetosiphonaceae bacterium]